MSSLHGMSIDATAGGAARFAADQLGHVRYFVIAVLATLLLLIATSCSAPETRLVKVPVEKEVVKEVEVEKVVEVVKEVPVEKVVEVVKEVPVEKEVVKEVEVPVEVVVEKEVIKEVEVEKVVTKEVIKEVPVEKVVTKEVVKEVPVEKVVTKEVVREVVVTGDASTAPPGRQLAQHTHEGEIYTLVEYDHQIAVFSASGSPVSNSRLADDVLLSYAWGQTLAGLDVAGIAASVAAVEGMDDNIDGVRASSNETVRVLAQLDALSAQVPLIGRVSAMDVIAEVYPGVAAAASAIRALDAELDSLGRNADALAALASRIERADPSDVSGGDMDAAFGSAVKAARDMEESVGSARGKVTDVRNVSGELANALRQVSDTPVIGETLAESAETAARFESELSGIADTLQSYESGLANLAGQLQSPLDTTAGAHQSYVGRWLQRPYDTAWRDGVGSRPAPVAAQPTPAPAGPAQQPFRLSWAASASGVSGGESFTLTVRMHGVRESGDHGGISVSFPSLTESGGSGRSYSSSLADVEAVEYTSGMSNVAFHQPGASIYRSDNSTQFPANHLLVESDDATWSTSDDRTLRLRITPKRGGEFPIRVRGWLCVDGYTNCSRSPTEAAVTDQQGWGVEVAEVAVSGDAGPAIASRHDTLSVGWYHACGVEPDGTLTCWGEDDNTGRTSAPPEKFVAVSAGYNHTCGVKTDGSVACWGNNKYGKSSPLRGEFVTVSTGYFHTCGIRPDGTIECWGTNYSGETSPPGGKFVSISSGGRDSTKTYSGRNYYDYTCGVTTHGFLACWGNIGSPPSGEFVTVSAGSRHICGVKTDGAVECWGNNNDDQASPPDGKFVAVGAGNKHTCGVKTDGYVVCWGDKFGKDPSPPAGAGKFVSVSAGANGYSCGVKTDGSFMCWGGDN